MHPRNFEGIDDFYYGVIESDGEVRRLMPAQTIELEMEYDFTPNKSNKVMVALYVILCIITLLKVER